jgi:hypothetical protein
VIVKVAGPVPAELVAEMLTTEVPPAEGVPEINPVEVLSERPAGNPVAPNEVGLLLAAIW